MAKKIGIISDTHGLLRPEVLEILRTCDCILHGGDINKPEILDQIRPLASVYVVRGIDDRLWINPGSCGRRRFDQEITMAVMHVDAGRYQVEKIVIEP